MLVLTMSWPLPAVKPSPSPAQCKRYQSVSGTALACLPGSWVPLWVQQLQLRGICRPLRGGLGGPPVGGSSAFSKLQVEEKELGRDSGFWHCWIAL